MGFGTDLDKNTATDSVAIVGQDNTGTETTPVKSYGSGDIGNADILDRNDGVYGVLTVGLTAVEVKVGASKLTDRKTVTLFNESNKSIFWGYNNSVTISTGSRIWPKQMVAWSVSDNTPIWVISDTASLETRITEA